jgi:Ca-activated chloride channel family protein
MTLLDLGFMRPERLWFLWALPGLLLVYAVLVWRKRTRVARQNSALNVLFPKRSAWLRHAAVVAAVLSLGALNVAWAQPNGWVEVPRERATIFLVIDVSFSMRATDVEPNRLSAAKTAAKEFVGEVPAGFNICVIAFAGTVETLVAPTTDRQAAVSAIDGLEVAPMTATGEAISAAVQARVLIPPDPDHPDEPPPAAIVLLSDGERTTGLGTVEAAEQAKAAGIPVSTIAFGTDHGTIEDQGTQREVPVNREELQQIAEISGGRAYSAEDLAQLREVYQNISQEIGYEEVEDEITGRFVGYAIALALVAAVGLILLGARWP